MYANAPPQSDGMRAAVLHVIVLSIRDFQMIVEEGGNFVVDLVEALVELQEFM